MALTDTFSQFTQELSGRLNLAQKVGMSQDQIAQRAEQIGDWLAQEVEPKSPEQRLLKQLWEVSDNNEQKAIASAMVKLVQK